MSRAILISAAVVALLAACQTASSSAKSPQPSVGLGRSQPSEDEASRAQAWALFTANRIPEAAAAFDRMIALHPDDKDLLFGGANAYAAQAQRESCAETSQAMARKARELAASACKLGSDEPMLKLILESFHEDGSPVAGRRGIYSARREVQALLMAGEAAFEKGNFEEARSRYRQALDMEPQNFWATLWTGDVHSRLNDLKGAVEWFEKAVAIDRDAETPHRHLANVLVRLGQEKEALSEYIEAVIAGPFDRFPRHALLAFTKNFRRRRERPIPRFPIAAASLKGNDVKVLAFEDEAMKRYVDTTLAWRLTALLEEPKRRKLLEDASMPSAGPEGPRRARMLKYAQRRRSLPEEVEALERMIDVRDDSPEWKARIEGLAMLKLADLLEPYALLERADDELFQDYATYRLEHREKLERYIRLYWCGLD